MIRLDLIFGENEGHCHDKNLEFVVSAKNLRL
jgi:hypothetical protein